MKSERAKQYLLKAVTPMAMMYPDCPEECDLKLGEAKQSREIGCRLVRVKGRRIFLDELDPEARGGKIKSYECGIFCDL